MHNLKQLRLHVYRQLCLAAVQCSCGLRIVIYMYLRLSVCVLSVGTQPWAYKNGWTDRGAARWMDTGGHKESRI